MGGIVYCLTNPAMPTHVKIGWTQDLEKRLKQLDNTSTPLPFECLYAIEVPEPKQVERLLHNTFADSRTRKSREFFEISPQRVISAMKLANGRDVTPTEDTVEDEETRAALSKARTRRAAFNFSMVNLKKGTRLEFYDDPELVCTVTDSKHVHFRGEDLTLSRAAANILIERKEAEKQDIPEWLRTGSVQGTIYWCHAGEALNELRTRIEQDV